MTKTTRADADKAKGVPRQRPARKKAEAPARHGRGQGQPNAAPANDHLPNRSLEMWLATRQAQGLVANRADPGLAEGVMVLVLHAAASALSLLHGDGAADGPMVLAMTMALVWAVALP